MHSLGRLDEAAEIVDSLLVSVEGARAHELGTSGNTLIRDLSAYFAWVGEVGESLRYLELAFQGTPYGLDFRLWNSGLYDQVKASPQSASRYSTAGETAWSRVLGELERASTGIPNSLF